MKPGPLYLIAPESDNLRTEGNLVQGILFSRSLNLHVSAGE